MTAVTPDTVDGATLRLIGMGTIQSRLTALLEDRQGGSGWWVEVTRQLDALADAVRNAPGDVIDAVGFTDQIRTDAPQLLGRWMRLVGERDDLYDAVSRVRLMAGEAAGDAQAVGPISRAIVEILARVRRLQERTTDVLLDAYERDGGGE